MSLMVSLCAVLFFRGYVLDEIRDLIESVSLGFPSYSLVHYYEPENKGQSL